MKRQHKKELAAIAGELESLRCRIETLKEEGIMDPRITAALATLDADVVTLSGKASGSDVPAIVAAINASDAKVKAAISGGPVGNAPSISSLSQITGPVNTSVVITGQNFGASQGSSTVTFNGTLASIASWADTSIQCSVPVGATTGDVIVTTSAGKSAANVFTVA